MREPESKGVSDFDVKGNSHPVGYRPDIDGLRTVAVLAVVLFHLDVNIISGGFAGVDIFFVISGYLITGIVQREIFEERFSVLAFYERRIRRIFPALFAMLACVFIAALLMFMPDEMKDTGASFLATATFSSNFLFWMQADYFAGPVEFKPLLHTWSLAVEEQFYLLFPLVIYLLHRWRPLAVKPAVAAMLALSFATSCAWVFIDPSGNYYLPHTRAWELLVGSVIAMGMVPVVRSKAVNNCLSILGLFLLIAPLVVLDKQSVFPAWNALPACLGAGLLIHTGSQSDSIGRRVLGFRPIALFGLISYSLYLVHWPLIVFAKYHLMRELLPNEKLIVMGAMFALAWLSWRFVEAPFRSCERVARKSVFVLGLVGSFLAMMVGATAFALQGIPQRFGAQADLAKRDDAQTRQRATCFLKEGWQSWEGDKCFVTANEGQPVTLLWGDSHANQYVEAIRANAASINSRVLIYASAGCAPILGVDFPKRPYCRGNNMYALDIIKRYKIRKVVLSGYWERIFDENGLGFEDMSGTLTTMKQMGVNVAIIGDNPDYPFANPQYLAVRLAKREKPLSPFFATIRNSRDFNAQFAQAAQAAVFYDPMNDLCRDRECLVYNQGKVLMRDNAHLSTYGAKFLLDRMTARRLLD